MIWLQRDSQTGEYGLRYFDADDGSGGTTREIVVRPFFDETHGCDWERVRPEWVKDHVPRTTITDDDEADSMCDEGLDKGGHCRTM